MQIPFPSGMVDRERKEEEMKRMAMQLRRGVFGAGVALSLGVGASAAVAAPGPGVDRDPKCKDETCDRLCRLIGAHSGQCTEGGGCACAL